MAYIFSVTVYIFLLILIFYDQNKLCKKGGGNPKQCVMQNRQPKTIVDYCRFITHIKKAFYFHNVYMKLYKYPHNLSYFTSLYLHLKNNTLRLIKLYRRSTKENGVAKRKINEITSMSKSKKV